MSQLVWAVKNGELDDVKSVLEKDKSLVNTLTEETGRAPLHFAADYGQRDMVEYLISQGADVNKPDKYGITPLLTAIFEGHAECVDVLIKKGASKAGKAPDGRSYLECAETDDIKGLLK